MGALTSTVNPDGDSVVVKFSGTLDEDTNFDGSALSQFKNITLDLKEVERVTSKGVRAWMLWVARLDNTKAFQINDLSRVFVTQANLIPGMIPNWMKVNSLELPYYCAACGNSFGRVISIRNGQIPNEVELKVPCMDCKGTAEFDAIVERYFQFLKPRTPRK